DIEPSQVSCLNKPRAADGPGYGYRDRADTTVITLVDGAQCERHVAQDRRMVTSVRALATLKYPAAHFDGCDLPGLVGNRSDRRQWAVRVRPERARRSSPCSRRYCRSFDQQLRGHQASDRVSCDTGGHLEPASKPRACDPRLSVHGSQHLTSKREPSLVSRRVADIGDLTHFPRSPSIFDAFHDTLLTVGRGRSGRTARAGHDPPAHARPPRRA